MSENVAESFIKKLGSDFLPKNCGSQAICDLQPKTIYVSNIMRQGKIAWSHGSKSARKLCDQQTLGEKKIV